jgi:hypothetical protein
MCNVGKLMHIPAIFDSDAAKLQPVGFALLACYPLPAQRPDVVGRITCLLD